MEILSLFYWLYNWAMSSSKPPPVPARQLLISHKSVLPVCINNIMHYYLWFGVCRHFNLLVFWFFPYIMCTIVLLVSEVTGLQDPHIDTHSIKPLMVSDAPDGTGFWGPSLISCSCDLLTAHTFSWCGHQHTIPTLTPSVMKLWVKSRFPKAGQN